MFPPLRSWKECGGPKQGLFDDSRKEVDRILNHAMTHPVLSLPQVKHFWENSDLYAGTGVKAMARLLGIVHMNPEVDPQKWDHVEEELYGLGGVRTPELFYDLFGIDVVKKKTEGHLCAFVENGRMHREWTPLLRSDGMGIDYSSIHFRWVDPTPDAKKFK